LGQAPAGLLHWAKKNEKGKKKVGLSDRNFSSCLCGATRNTGRIRGGVEKGSHSSAVTRSQNGRGKDDPPFPRAMEREEKGWGKKKA